MRTLFETPVVERDEPGRGKIHSFLVQLQQQRQRNPDPDRGGDRQERRGRENEYDCDLRVAPGCGGWWRSPLAASSSWPRR